MRMFFLLTSLLSEFNCGVRELSFRERDKEVQGFMKGLWTETIHCVVR